MPERTPLEDRIKALEGLLDYMMDYVMEDFPEDARITKKRARELFAKPLKLRLALALTTFFGQDIPAVYVEELERMEKEDAG